MNALPTLAALAAMNRAADRGWKRYASDNESRQLAREWIDRELEAQRVKREARWERRAAKAAKASRRRNR